MACEKRDFGTSIQIDKKTSVKKAVRHLSYLGNHSFTGNQKNIG